MKNVACRFDEVVRRHPHSLAVVSHTHALSFENLSNLANGLADCFWTRGVRPGSVVALHLPRGPLAIACMLACFRLGCAYVPIDPDLPPGRKALIADDCGAAVVACDRAAPEIAATPVLVSEAMSSPEMRAPSRRVDFAYLLYTSGSSGRPKGVMGSHSGLLNRLDWGWDSFPLAPDEVCCHRTALGFVDSLAEIWTPLLRGLPLVVVPDDEARDPHRFVAALASQGVTRLVAVPSLLQAILHGVPEASSALRGLRLCVSSGEALSASLATAFQRTLPNCRLVNLYGSTEVAADATAHVLGASDGMDIDVPIGTPISNVTAVVLDPYGNPVADGEPGELHVSCPGLSPGYWNAPARTAERFVPDPFATAPGARLFRTGDIAVRTASGGLRFVGRADQQLKIRGHRIELGEIEAAAAGHPGVQQCVAVTTGSGLGIAVALFVQLRAGLEIAPDELRRFLARSLPDYMMPRGIVMLDALPRLYNGKIDRQALFSLGAARRDEPVPPETVTEQGLALIWAEVLRETSVSRRDSFFDLGGNSLLSAQAISRVRERFGVDLTYFDIRANPTLSALAKHIDLVLAAACLDGGGGKPQELELSEF